MADVFRFAFRNGRGAKQRHLFSESLLSETAPQKLNIEGRAVSHFCCGAIWQREGQAG